MPFNGSGVFSPPGANYPAVANETATAGDRNAIDADFATGLSNCITKDGQTTVSTDIPLGNNKITGLANGTVITDAATLDNVKKAAGVYVWNAATGLGVADDTAALQSCLDAMSSGETLVLNGNYKITGAGLDITSKSRIRITGKGRLFLSGANSDAMIINLNGTCDDVEIDGLTLVGDNNATYTQHGIGNYSGQTLSRLRIHDLNISNINVGIGLIGVSGTCSNCQIYNNDLVDIRGTSGGQGYGLFVDTCLDSQIWGNTVDDAERHSIYISRGTRMRAFNNIIKNHRKDVADLSFRAAFSIARCTYVEAFGNKFYNCFDSSMGIEHVTADSENCTYIDAHHNLFYDKGNNVPDLYIGQLAIPTSYKTSHVHVHDNVVVCDFTKASTDPNFKLNNGTDISINRNKFVTTGVTGSARHILVGVLTPSYASDDCTRVEVLDNEHTFEGADVTTTRAIQVDDDLSATFTSDIFLGRADRLTGTATAVALGGSWVNTNLVIEDPKGIREGSYQDADATPSVKNINSLYITNTGATTITALDDGESGQQIMLGFADANTTLSNSYFYLNGTTSWTPTANSRILVEIRGSFAYEIGRSEP